MQPEEKRLPVYIVDDDQAACESLSMMLEDHDFHTQAYTDGRFFLENYDPSAAGCVILDSRMPDLNGQQLHQRLREEGSPLSVIFLTGYGDVPMAVQALQSGAVHFFQKPVKADVLIPAIEDALYTSLEQAEKLALRKAFDTLTSREIDILKLLIIGQRNASIADELCIAVRTVEVHRASLMKKFAANTIAELAFRYGKLNETL